MTAASLLLALRALIATHDLPFEIASASSRSPGEACFQSSTVQPDWKSLAERQPHAEELLAPDRAALERNFNEPGGTSYFDFEAPADAELKAIPWLLLHQGGVERVHAATLRGWVRYSFDPKSDRPPGAAELSGYICIKGLSPDLVAAFVLGGADLTTPDIQVLDPRYPEVGVATVTWDGALYQLSAPDLSGPKIARVFAMDGLASKDLLLVRWFTEPAEPDCEVAFDLYLLSQGAASHVASSAYGCDP